MKDIGRPKRYRTIFVSDIHLGTRGSQAGLFLDFLRDYEADTIVLVGDIIDGWRLKVAWYWPQAHNDVVQKILRKVRKGTRLIYIPGNHDEFLRDYTGTHFGGIEVVEEAIHVGADGRRYLVMHGDKFDSIIRHARWLALLGDSAYDFAIFINSHISRIRRWFGLPYWSFSQWSKAKVKTAVNFVTDFEKAVVHDAQRHQVDGVICGHIHQPVIQHVDGVVYMNCGDWVESCTAIVEHPDGRFELIRIADANTLEAIAIGRKQLSPAV